MTYLTNTPENFEMSLPITSQATQLAHQFADQQPTLEKRDRVALNTLSVCVVNDYLQMLGFQTSPEQSDSWNAIARLTSDVADLEVIGAGRLECLPVRRGQLECRIPPDVWHDRIAYVLVQLDLDEKEGTILGFVPQASATVRLGQLRSLDDLIDHMHHCMAVPIPTQVGQWLQGILSEGWQTVESLLRSPEFAFRTGDTANSIQGAKRIDFGMQLSEDAVALVVDVLPDEQRDRTRIRLQVHPTENPYLPPNLQMMVIDQSGALFLEAQSRALDNFIQLQFTGTSGESFAVQVVLGDVQVTEYFSL